MPVVYSDAAKRAGDHASRFTTNKTDYDQRRLEGIRDFLAGGKLQLLDAADKPLAEYRLDGGGGYVIGRRLTFVFSDGKDAGGSETSTAPGLREGTVTRAKIASSSGADGVSLTAESLGELAGLVVDLDTEVAVDGLSIAPEGVAHTNGDQPSSTISKRFDDAQLQFTDDAGNLVAVADLFYVDRESLEAKFSKVQITGTGKMAGLRVLDSSGRLLMETPLPAKEPMQVYVGQTLHLPRHFIGSRTRDANSASAHRVDVVETIAPITIRAVRG
jgi:hypothetical protein